MLFTHCVKGLPEQTSNCETHTTHIPNYTGCLRTHWTFSIRCHRHTKRTYRAKNNIILYRTIFFEKRGKNNEKQGDREHNTIFSYWQLISRNNNKFKTAVPTVLLMHKKNFLYIPIIISKILYSDDATCDNVPFTRQRYAAIIVTTTVRQPAVDLALYRVEDVTCWPRVKLVRLTFSIFFPNISLTLSHSAFSHRARQVQIIVVATSTWLHNL